VFPLAGRICVKEFSMRASLLALLLLAGVFARAAFFTDVAEGGHRGRTIADMAYHQLMEGFPDGTFHPDAPLLRADTVMILARLLNTSLKGFMVLPGQGPAALRAADVPDRHWMHAAADFLSARGMLPAPTDGRFGPAQPVSRGQFLQALYRLQHRGTTVNPAEAAAWMEARDLLPAGWGDDLAAPAVRAETAGLLDDLLLYLTQHAETEGTVTALETDADATRWVKLDTAIGPCRLALPTRGVVIHGGEQADLKPGAKLRTLSDAVSAVTPYYRVREVWLLPAT
jgi:hypothetical protein